MSNKDLNHKMQLLSDAAVQLKKEFVGIDYQIDQVLDNLRTWFLFPELQERPLVISLFGMSGCGKTDLVKRISELLNIQEDYVYFNFAQIEEMSSWEIEDTLEENLSNVKSNRMFVYDEFQYAATLNKAGEEKDKKSCLKTFWELMDTGIFRKRYSFSNIFSLKRLLKMIEAINEVCEIKIENCVWVNEEECLQHFGKYERQMCANVFNLKKNTSGNTSSVIGYNEVGSEDTFISKNDLDNLRVSYIEYTGNKEMDKIDFFKLVSKFNIQDWINLIKKCLEHKKRGYEMDFKKSVIFVIANIDEAYTMSFNVNPDMSPDQFNALTKKLTIVDMKEALQRRFRNEQIARLGNMYVIYPSFSCDTFRKIIDLYLDKYAVKTYNELGYKIEYDKSVKDIIYKEGVFPTQGARPIFSTIQEIVRSKLPMVIEKTYIDSITIDTIKYSFKRGYTIATVFENGKQVGKYTFKEKLKVDNLRASRKDDKQALIAVHESGHFVMYAKLKGSMPKMVRSVTTDTNSAGFLMGDENENCKPSSAKDILDDIKISLGGYVAEELVFGREHMTCGASSDLQKATVLASKYVRSYCLGSFEYVSTYATDINTSIGGNLIKDDATEVDINREIVGILHKCMTEVRNTFKNYEWYKMLKNSAKYLSKNSSLPHNKMLEFYNSVSEKARNERIDKDYYKNIVDKF